MVSDSKNKIINLSIVFVTACLLASCGGGGGGGGVSSKTNDNFSSGTSEGSYNSSTASSWASNEEFDGVLYASSYGGRTTVQNPYEVMNVHKAYGYGLSGDGYYIHVQDDQIDFNHMEWAGKTINLHQSNASTDNNSNSSVGWHGAAVASVALGAYNNNSEDDIMGVAYNADLHYSDYDTLKSGYNDYASHYANALDGAPSNTAASNHSYGVVGTNIQTVINYKNNNNVSNAYTVGAYLSAAGLTSSTSNAQTWLNSLNTFQDNKGVIVWSLSNDTSHTEAHWMAGLPELETTLQDAWITVGTVDISGSVGNETYTSVYSDCGSTAAYCLVTDSYGTRTASYENQLVSGIDTDGSSSYYYTAGIGGNSFGAPMVAGLVTLLNEAFPSLTPEQITDRLLATADNTFFTATANTSFTNGVTHGYNSVYGHGIPDIYKALQPITTSMFDLSILTGDNINNSNAYSLSASGLSMDTAFGDALSNGLENETGVFFDALYGNFDYDLSESTNIINNNSQKDPFEKRIAYNTLQLETKNGINSNFVSVLDNSNNGNFINPNKGFAYTAELNNNDFVISKKMPLEAVLGFYSLDDDVLINKNREVFRIPFIQDADDGFSYASNIIKDGNNSISIGYYNTNDNDTYDKQAFVSSFNFGSKGSKKSIVLGYLEEEERFLNSTTGGAFNLNGKNIPTNFISKKLNKKFSNGNELLLTASYGVTNVKTNKDTLINKIDNLSSSSFAINYLNLGLINKKDSFSITLNQPHRIETGSANIAIPSGRDKSGNLYYRNKDIPLSPSGRQLDLSMAYNYNFSQRSSMSANASITNNYNHIKDNEVHNSLSLMYNLSF